MGDVIQTILSPEGGPVAFPGSAPELPACSMAPRSWGLGCSKDKLPQRSQHNEGRPNATQTEGEHWLSRSGSSDVALT